MRLFVAADVDSNACVQDLNCMHFIYLTHMIYMHTAHIAPIIRAQIHRVWDYLMSFIFPMDQDRELPTTRCAHMLCSIVHHSLCMKRRGVM